MNQGDSHKMYGHRVSSIEYHAMFATVGEGRVQFQRNVLHFIGVITNFLVIVLSSSYPEHVYLNRVAA